ncbi:AbrB/MazE/SpoVT family DNA-binding domain-containing protein [Candidatus Chloroploca sp. M-50]|uniref:AbrB/MazE/SpoVT family DNA-binding domain-containing protein n=1 Tax=Candidatus Chloroploca mongolica TaxID=2528176 RepID=A0ABS4D4B9_9CHLR|nr:AbrB/MazE/SpoVT family DNA-binding domain-containing protein [Candidatus Chloroploca mongolica]MBP1464285.1 AbrB/MazE/SpoVT family DNA-binding domain-containing protein [Candidatus Chloroploca mongolica]
MQSKVQKWGNSLALRIPKSFAAEIGLSDGTPVELTLVEGKLVIAPLPVPSYSLEALLAGITPANLHGELDTGAPQGTEVW